MASNGTTSTLIGMQERIEEARQRLSRAAHQLREKGEETWGDVTKYVQKNPGKTLAFSTGAAALGILLGVFLGRQGRRQR